MNGLSRILGALGVAALLVASPAIAQPNQGRGPRADRADRVEWRLDMLDRRLDLTDEQRSQLQELMVAQRDEAVAWFDAHPNATRTERMEFRDTHRQAMLEKVEAILTPEQLTEYKELRDTRFNRSPRGRRGR